LPLYRKPHSVRNVSFIVLEETQHKLHWTQSYKWFFSLDVIATSMSVPKSNEALDNCLSTCTKSQYFQVYVSLQDTTKPGNQW
jgi:hypothetical protein